MHVDNELNKPTSHGSLHLAKPLPSFRGIPLTTTNQPANESTTAPKHHKPTATDQIWSQPLQSSLASSNNENLSYVGKKTVVIASTGSLGYITKRGLWVFHENLATKNTILGEPRNEITTDSAGGKSDAKINTEKVRVLATGLPTSPNENNHSKTGC